MKESGYFKFYVAKYILLAFSLLQFLTGLFFALSFQLTPRRIFLCAAIFTSSLIVFSIHIFFVERFKRVALDKKKIAVIEFGKSKTYSWNEVKYLKAIPYLNIYILKLKGKKHAILFMPSSHQQTIYGMFTDAPDFISKRLTRA